MTTVSLVETVRHALMGFSVLSILKALLIAVLGFVIYKLIIKGLTMLLNHSKVSPHVCKIIVTVSKVCLIMALMIIVFSELGINTSSLLIILAVCLAVFFFAAQDILTNIASGLVISSTSPFKKGDIVTIDSYEGEVYESLLNCTRLKCYNGEIITIPNKDIANSKIINYSIINARRAHIIIVASYDNDPDRVMTVCRKVIDSTEGILHELEPKMFISGYMNSNLEYSFYFWVKPGNRNYKEQELTGNIYRTFKREGIAVSHPGIIIDSTVKKYE